MHNYPKIAIGITFRGPMKVLMPSIVHIFPLLELIAQLSLMHIFPILALRVPLYEIGCGGEVGAGD